MLLLRVTVLLLLVFGLWDSATASAGSQGAIDCCLATSNNRIPGNIVKTFVIQSTEGGCRIDATLFITERGKKLCAPPKSKQKWVRELIKKIEKQQQQSGKGNRKGKKQRRRGKNRRNKQ